MKPTAAFLLFLSLPQAFAATVPAPATPPAVAAPSPATPPAVADPSPAERPRPAAPVREVRETLHGVEVVDPYRWMEDVQSPDAQAFFRAQDENARKELARIPGRAALAERIRELSAAQVAVRNLALASGKVFYLKLAPGQDTPVLCVRDGFAGAERVLLDPARYGTPAGRAAISWYHPSPDGRLVAYGISLAGTEDATLRVLEVEGARDTGVAIDRTRFNAGLSWHHDSRAFYYSRIPEGGPADRAHRYAGIRVYRHVVGRAAARTRSCSPRASAARATCRSSSTRRSSSPRTPPMPTRSRGTACAARSPST